jgi:hypothetical protein
MSNLENALRELREKRSHTQIEIDKLDQIISRILERNRNRSTWQDNPVETSYIRSFTAQNGLGTESPMGKGTRRVATNSSGEGHGLGSCEAHHVGIGPQEDRGGTKGAVGEATGAGVESGLG